MKGNMSDGCPDRIVSGTLPPHFKEVKGIMRSDEGLYDSFWVMKSWKRLTQAEKFSLRPASDRILVLT